MGLVTSDAFLFAVLAAPVVAVAVLTGVGSRRRGAPWPLAAVSGALFPVTWVVWYVRDEHPLSRYRATK